jgi:hypothetical protein
MSDQSRWSSTQQARSRPARRHSTADEVGQHSAHDVAVEAPPRQRPGDTSPLHVPRLALHAGELLSGERSSGAKLVFSVDVIQRKVDVYPGDSFGMEFVPQRCLREVTATLTGLDPVLGESLVVDEARLL